MRLVYITLARKILCYGSFPAKVLLGTNAFNSHNFKTIHLVIRNNQRFFNDPRSFMEMAIIKAEVGEVERLYCFFCSARKEDIGKSGFFDRPSFTIHDFNSLDGWVERLNTFSNQIVVCFLFASVSNTKSISMENFFRFLFGGFRSTSRQAVFCGHPCL